MRRTIGISFACLVTSACAVTNAPEQSTTDSPDDSTVLTTGTAEMQTDKSRSVTCTAAQQRPSADGAFDQAPQQRARFGPAGDECGGVWAPCCTRARAAGIGELGKGAWYNLVGNRTASGEILDTITATAAHRSLPLASYAKVTSLDSGLSVIVKINDRGPYTHGRIIDLSPRAADALDMKRAGVAVVVIEPLVN
jgi:rare lipoprotein A